MKFFIKSKYRSKKPTLARTGAEQKQSSVSRNNQIAEREREIARRRAGGG